MWLAFGLAGFVVLIACANLANLQLVRTLARTREHAVRAALGAGRFRLIRQSLTETLVVSVMGGLLSIVVALAGVQLISRRLFQDLPGAGVTPDVNVFGFAFLCSILTGLVFGTLPAPVLAVTFGSTVMALATCYFPARRATRLNPLVALRHE
jgi:ABC-type antimicrobial peptide transport system permease subunit